MSALVDGCGGGSDVETVVFRFLNTHFGDALLDPGTCRRLLGVGSPGCLTLVGLTEITSGVREKSAAIVAAHGYRVVTPPEGRSAIDTLWAVDRRLAIETGADHTESAAQVFPGAAPSRPQRRYKRQAGMHTIVVTTPRGQRLRASTERLAPPIRGPLARYRHLRHLAAVLDSSTPPDAAVDVEVNGGDQNHLWGPGPVDRQLWESRGFSPGLRESTATYSLNGSLGKMLRRTGLHSRMQLDAVYLRPRPGRRLVHLDLDAGGRLAPGDIGVRTAVIPVPGSDHHLVEMTVMTHLGVR